MGTLNNLKEHGAVSKGNEGCVSMMKRYETIRLIKIACVACNLNVQSLE